MDDFIHAVLEIDIGVGRPQAALNLISRANP
jgi:hypothetical protein